MDFNTYFWKNNKFISWFLVAFSVAVLIAGIINPYGFPTANLILIIALSLLQIGNVVGEFIYWKKRIRK